MKTETLILTLFACGIIADAALICIVILITRQKKEKKYPKEVDWFLELDAHEKAIAD